MQTQSARLLTTLLLGCVLSIAATAVAQTITTVDFSSSPPFNDYPSFVERGFKFSTTIGEVRINDAFSLGDNGAQPSFGFGQGLQSGFMVQHDLNLRFDAVSIDLLEATIFAKPFGVTITGTQADSNTVTQTFTLDGVDGRETFTLPAAFSNLVSLTITEDATNDFFTEDVAIDNVRFRVAPGQVEPATLDVALYTGISVRGTLGATYRIECAQSSGDTNWVALTNIVLVTSPYLYFDPEPATNRIGKVYRAVALE